MDDHTAGAPETFRFDGSEEITLRVGQGVDIWSLGCIFSEVATWMNYDWQVVEEYRRRRGEEAREKLGKGCGDIFHDSSNILDAVRTSHDTVIDQKRPQDPITDKILKRLVPRMLCPLGQRASVNELLTISLQLVDDAKEGIRMKTDQKGPPLPPIEEHTPPDSGSLTTHALSVDGALNWRKQRKKKKKLDLPHEGTLKQLRGMRHVRIPLVREFCGADF